MTHELDWFLARTRLKLSILMYLFFCIPSDYYPKTIKYNVQ